MRLKELPTLRKGIVHHGSAQAVALWEFHKGCVIVSDGGSHNLFVARVGSRRVDTVTIRSELQAVRHAQFDSAAVAMAGGTDEPLPEPSLSRRITRLAIDPDGWVWMELPSVSDNLDGVNILRMHPGSGVEERLHAPFFPVLFPEPGEFVGLKPDSGGSVVLLRGRTRSGA
jgi:hypothetical protein